MKTSESFFPTRTHLKSRDIRHERTYQLIKKQEEHQDGCEEDDFTINIFKDVRHNPHRNDLDHAVERPIGGMELFRKMEQAGKDRLNQNRRHSKRSNKEATQRNISSNFNNNRFKKDKPDNDDRENQDALPIRTINETSNPQLRASLPEETFKEHLSYSPHTISLKSQTREFTTKTAGRSEVVFRPSSSKPSTKSTAVHDVWAADQRKQYQDKAALLNEINYNRPLVQIYGDRYFEYILRNRFEEDLKPPAYIYQIGASKFSESRVIDKIKKYRPDIKEKGMMVVRGRRLGGDEE